MPYSTGENMLNFIKFCLVGGSNTLITLLSFYMFNKVLNINYLISSILSYVCGMLNSFVLNKLWTFRNNEKRFFPQLVKFIIVNSISLCINLLLMYIITNKFHFDSMVSQVMATGLTIISNYGGSKLWVFKDLKIT